jgi:hypothetical protein
MPSGLLLAAVAGDSSVEEGCQEAEDKTGQIIGRNNCYFMNIVFLLIPLMLAFKGPNLVNPEKPDAISGTCDTIPVLNQQIIGFVKTRLNTSVGRGECWDLAATALNSNGAKWDKKYKFGRLVNVRNECVYPGDIIQFEGIKVKHLEGNRRIEETMNHHTAIIFEVKEKGIFVLAHQNTDFSGRKVGLSELNLENIIRGKFKIFRPEK